VRNHCNGESETRRERPARARPLKRFCLGRHEWKRGCVIRVIHAMCSTSRTSTASPSSTSPSSSSSCNGVHGVRVAHRGQVWIRRGHIIASQSTAVVHNSQCPHGMQRARAELALVRGVWCYRCAGGETNWSNTRLYEEGSGLTSLTSLSNKGESRCTPTLPLH
jgi:hypothetical protein